ncbi:hypothetical protein, partial [Streptomyces brasiliscabiei]|uniref:hypothetical protein n=1 Tax=Streptomyces brasiliscabiei TaxID=2736302 RepID=UPI0030145AC7
GGAAPVAVAVTHAEFGRVTLRFARDDDGLAVRMASPDPAFAPAAIAASTAAGELAGRMQSDSGQSQQAPPQSQAQAQPQSQA